MAVNEQYYTILTSYGKQALANAQASGTTVNLTEFAVGDGNGSYYSPNETQTSLVNEVYRAQINRITTDSNNPNWVIIEGIIPADQGGFTIREIGIFDDAGNLVAIGNYPETYKPVLSQGSGNDMYIRFIMEVENVDSVQLKIDPAIVLASRKYVDDEITAHDTSSTSHADIRTEIDNIKNGNTTVGNADKLDGLNSVNFIKALFHAGAVANTDLNSLVEAQTVYCDTTNTNLPSSYAGYLLVFGNGSNRIGQLFLSQDGNLYFRRSDDGVNWSPWGKVWFNGNDGVNSGLDADLLRGLPADFGSSLASSGYQKLPSGLIIQWGIVPRGSNDGTISVAFPIAFPNSVFGVGVSANSIGLTDARISRVHNVSLTGFDSVVDYFNTARDAGYSEFWVAIGY